MNDQRLKSVDECSDESERFEKEFERLFAGEGEESARALLVAEINDWLQDIAKQGRFIPLGSAERRAFRSLLERWSSLLRRQGFRLEGSDSLTDFDPNAGIVLTGDCPYPGLDPYTERWRHSFFGREALVSSSVEHLERQGNRILLIIGASGSGKSSLALAGILPRLMELHDGAWLFGPRLTPGAHPLAELAESVSQAIGQPEQASEIKHGLAAKPGEALGQLAELCQDKPLMLLIDQFEELLTLCSDAGEQSAFAQVLCSLSDPTAPARDFCCRTLLTLRTDHLARFESNNALKPLHMRLIGGGNANYLSAIGFGDIKRAIKEPAEKARLRFVPATLIDQLASQTGGLSNGLPLLQFALRRLWDTRPKNESGEPLDLITEEMVKALPDVERALGKVADIVFDKLSFAQQRVCKRLLLELVVLDESFEEPLRRRRNEAELRRVLQARFPKTGDVDDVDRVIGDFVEAGLLRRFGEGPESQLEVAHEALLRHWDQIYRLLTEADDKERLHLIKQIGREALEWMACGRKDDYLKLKGDPLDRAIAYAEDGWLAEAELTAYIEACSGQAAEERLREQRAQRADEEHRRAEEQARDATRFRRITVWLAGCILLAIGAIVFAYLEWEKATKQAHLIQEQKIEAELLAKNAKKEAARADENAKVAKQRESDATIAKEMAEAESGRANALRLAAAAINNLNEDPERSILLGLQAASISKKTRNTIPPGVEDALHQSVQASRLMRTLPSGHTDIAGQIYAIAVSPDGTKAATAGQDKKAIVWNLISGAKEQTLSGHKGLLKDVVFSHDGKLIATADDKGTVKLWDTSSGDERLELPCNKERGHFVVFSPDGDRLATTGDDNAAMIWDYKSHKLLFSLKRKQPVDCAAFSGDGRYIATGENGYSKDFKSENMIIIWDARTGEKRKELENQASISHVAFSADGKYVAAASGNRAKIWKWESEECLITLTGHINSINRITFDETGGLIATASRDHTAKIWYARDGRELMSLRGHRGDVTGVAFEPKANTVMTSSLDGTVKEWSTRLSLEFPSPVQHESMINEIAFSPDGTRLVTAGEKDQAVVSNVRGGLRGEERLSGFEKAVFTAAFSPDGKLIATAHEDKKVRVWHAASGELLRELDAHQNEVLTVAFDRNGKQVASASSDGMVIIWDLASGGRSHTISIPQEGQTTVLETVLKIFLILEPVLGEAFPLVPPVAFNSNLTSICTASSDGKDAIIFDVLSGKKKVTLKGHSDMLWSIAFSHDGKWVVTGSSDNTSKIWDAQTGKERLTLWGHRHKVTRAIFSNDDKRIATASLDRTVRVWDSATGQTVYTLHGHYSGINTVAFSNDGKLIASADRIGDTLLYAQNLDQLLTLARRRVTRPLNEEECRGFLNKEEECPRSVTAVDFYIRGRNNARSGDFRVATGDFRRAQQLDQEAMNFDPGREAAEIANERGEELILRARYQEATAILEKTAKFDPMNDRTYFLLGYANKMSGEWESAIGHFKQVSKDAPDYASALEYLGTIYHDHLGRYEDGYRTFRILIDVYGGNISNHMNLAEACITTKRWDEGRNLAQKILQESKIWRLNDCQELTMRFIVISSLVLQGKDGEAHGKIREFLDHYNNKMPGYKPFWTYDGTRKFLEKHVTDNARKNCLLKLVDILEKPTQNVTAEYFGEYMNLPRK